MLVLHQSNRLEHLADALAVLLAEQPGVPLRDQPVLVSSPGMGTWLQIRLAEKLGIAAGLSFPLPARWLWHQYRQLKQQVPEKSVWDKAPLSWVLWQKLDEICAHPDCAALRDYLGDDDALKRYRLCVRLADLYDLYQMHRPDWLQQWAQDRSPVKIPAGQGWQPALWKLLQGWMPDDEARRSILMDAQHWATLLQQANAQQLPERLVLFAAGNLSAALLQVLQAFSAVLDVHLFLLNPSADYWGDLRTRQAELKEKLRQQEQQLENDFFSSIGNPLLASLGAQGQSQLELLLANWDQLDAELDLFEAPVDDTLLGAIQADIFLLHDGADSPRPLPQKNIALHSCHSAMREVEVLHDRLLDLFARDPTLKPRDVIVMVPDVAPYAPLVEAVFGQGEQAAIPWAVADRTLADEVPLVRAFLSLLKPSLLRFSANEVFDLLEVPALRRRFGIDVDDLPLLRQWVRDSGIRWGLDAQHRQSLGFPANKQNTWAQGLERLLLAVASGDDALVWQNTLSVAGLQNSQVALAGKLASLIDALRRQEQWMSRARPAVEWQQFLLSLLEELFDGDDQDQLDLESVRKVIADWVHDQQLAGMDDAVPVEVVQAVLASEFGRASGGQRFLSGAVNICTLMPMRTVPFRVVCLLGMNESDYPHREHPPGYDLTVQYPRVGDRSRRAEDRYLFLEALLAARQHLHISWCGRDIRSNEKLPPSVVVADLIDYIDRAFIGEGDQCASHSLLTEHALQPFSAHNFEAARPAQQSYSPLWYRVAANQPPQDSDAALPEVAMPEQVSLDELAAFLIDPAAAFLQQRYRVRLGSRDEQLDDDEPQLLSGLERWQLRNESASEMLHGGAELPLAERWWLEGRVPPGPAGEQGMQQQLGDARAFADRVRQHWPTASQRLLVSEPIGATLLTGVIADVSEQGRYFWSASKLFQQGAQKTPWLERVIAPKRILPAWLAHLLLNTQALPDAARTSQGCYEDVRITLAPLPAEQARAELATLLALYHQGLQAPLPVLPLTGWATVAGMDAEATFENECAATLSAARVFTETPDADTLERLGEQVWSLLRDSIEVSTDD